MINEITTPASEWRLERAKSLIKADTKLQKLQESFVKQGLSADEAAVAATAGRFERDPGR